MYDNSQTPSPGYYLFAWWPAAEWRWLPVCMKPPPQSPRWLPVCMVTRSLWGLVGVDCNWPLTSTTLGLPLSVAPLVFFLCVVASFLGSLVELHKIFISSLINFILLHKKKIAWCKKKKTNNISLHFPFSLLIKETGICNNDWGSKNIYMLCKFTQITPRRKFISS